MKSFAASVRDALTRVDVFEGKVCCRMAELTGFALSSGSITLGGGGPWLTLRVEHAGTMRRMVRVLKHDLGVSPVVRIVRASRLGGQTTFEARLEKGDAMRAMRQFGFSPLERAVPRHCLLKKCCRGAFLRGVFLGRGTVSDPGRGYQLEFILSGEETARAVQRFLKAFYAVKAGLSVRKDGHIVYVRDADDIIVALSLIGAHGAILEIENMRIVRDARNRANRAANCDTANITKMLGAADRHMRAIAQIERAIGLSALPEPLYEIAIERREHADASLEELGAMLDPPVGKSGVYRRLRRIEAIAETLEKQRGEEV